MTQSKAAEIYCIDLSISNPELEACQEFTELSPFPVSYHCPPMKGMESLLESDKKGPPKALLVLGSAASVWDDLPWQREFHPWLEAWLSKEIPTFGICYGHQLIAYLLGAKLGRVPTGKKYIEVRSIDIIKKNPFGLEKRPVKIVVSHQDEVKELPKGMVQFATSPQTPYEGLYHEDLPIITVQSHPEARTDFYTQRGLEPSDVNFADGRRVMKAFLDYLARS